MTILLIGDRRVLNIFMFTRKGKPKFMKNVRGMNFEQLTKQESDMLYSLYQEPFINQRILSETTGHSLGVVNRSLKHLMSRGYLDGHAQLTAKSRELFKSCMPANAIILAAGFGMRMVPINISTPKALLEVNGERMIDRLIVQLHEVGVADITVVVGFMKDSFEYLIDEYGVRLAYAPAYASTNNIHSLNIVADRIDNTYIVPCDIWCDRNPFRRQELYSWYMVSDLVDETSDVRVNRKMELVKILPNTGGNGMVGISYLTGKEADIVKKRIQSFAMDKDYENKFWEEALYQGNRMIVAAKVVHSSDVVEINTYEQLRELDSESGQLRTDAIDIICKVLHARPDEITDITVLKKGMTNRSFLFSCRGRKYIMRIPGEGTDRLIDRRQEASVYQAVAGKRLCDDIAYIDPANGYKITVFWERARVCDPSDEHDVRRCMERLREFHGMKLAVGNEFDIFAQIGFYESMWNGTPSIYKDYQKTKESVFRLRGYIDAHAEEKVLTHIDAVPDNFLLIDADGREEVRLIDWEYAGMQDPHVDIAMFCIYAMYGREYVDRLIDAYFTEGCGRETRIKIYCYIAACGLLWSNWCEFKRNLGVEFGEYSLQQYRYAKEYYRIDQEELERMGGDEGCIR